MAPSVIVPKLELGRTTEICFGKHPSRCGSSPCSYPCIFWFLSYCTLLLNLALFFETRSCYATPGWPESCGDPPTSAPKWFALLLSAHNSQEIAAFKVTGKKQMCVIFPNSHPKPFLRCLRSLWLVRTLGSNHRI